MKTRSLLLTFGLFLIVGLPRLTALDAHWASDESTWLYRSALFMRLLESGAFQQTLITHHPGVTTTWLGGLRSVFKKTDTWLSQKDLALARWFLCVAITAALFVVLFLLRALFDVGTATGACFFLIVDPFLLSQTRRVHTDALATIFIVLTVLLFLRYCQRDTQTRTMCGSLIFAGICFGLACLSKSYALILLPWLPLCGWIFRTRNTPWGEHLKRGGVAAVFFLSCSLLTVFIVWPVFWHLFAILLAGGLLGATLCFQRALHSGRHVPLAAGAAVLCLIAGTTYAVKTLWIVFDKLGWAVTTAHEIDHFFLGEIIADPGWLFYLFTLSIKSTPFVLPLAIGALLFLWKHRHETDTAKTLKTAIALGTVALLFTVCLSLTSKKFARYLLPAFPMLDLLAGIGLFSLVKGIGATLKKQHLRYAAQTGCVGLVLLLTVVPVFALHPYYGTYYNPCWKVTDITKIITVNDTSGVYLAAAYLNQKTDAPQLAVQASDLGAEFLRYYFQGTVYRSDTDRIAGSDALRDADYEVVYIRDLQIGRVPKEGKRRGRLEHVISLNGIEHVWIYRIPHNEPP